MKFASIGECMIEISILPDGSALKSFGGDTLNTAVYLSRLGMPVEYVTALGQDPYSDQMLEAWKAEGVGTELVSRLANRVPGLYMINTDDAGERSFHYWRDQAPAREVFDGEEGSGLAERMARFDALYFSGITLSILSAEGREKLRRAAASVRKNGGHVIFDGNYRPRGWADANSALQVFEDFLPTISLALPTLDDEQSLRQNNDLAAEAVADLYLETGVDEVVVKQGPVGAFFASYDNRGLVPVPEQISPVDTTAAGDSFNAGYIQARLSGKDPVDAAAKGHRLAGAVIASRGAIIPLSSMPGRV
ncbi:MAG: sugar kinase [Alphaproteobacteria bacterium]|jgi:2-dehydro-3-deoxygluconokinase|nr:sugar kinase [Alphaproteobacteria bacterium]MBT4086266.1 sugar kinase [Alphaproteobacteria bacterium]MBT4543883.1 sugar kinase [Alphaproteobacteria bacterium]MBT7745252.1 sugar kinase [Alphaproteobacteria bacterium]